MNRREFTTTALSTLFGYCCICCQEARASSSAQGCRRVGGSGAQHSYDLRQSSGDEDVDRSCREVLSSLIEKFGVRPGFSFYLEAGRGNAEATTQVLFPDGPDGTVLLGTKLTDSEMKGHVQMPKFFQWLMSPQKAIHLIMAHEFAHILQFKNFKDSLVGYGPWELEPHADFMAGWFLEQGRGVSFASFENAVAAMFNLGDTDFKDPHHHGQPHFRAAMVRAGSEAAQLNARAAFEKGMRWATVPLVLPP